MKSSKLIIGFLLFLIVTPLFANNILLIVGDSLSSGHGINTNQGWVYLLKQKLKTTHPTITVINASTSGDTTSNGLAKLPKLLKQYQPQWVIIELGGNDGLRGLPLGNMQENLSKMIQLSKKAGAKVILLGVRIPPNYGPIYFDRFQQVYKTLAKQYNIPLVPKLLKGVAGRKALMQSDEIHPKASAQKTMLNNVWPTLKPELD